MKNKKEYQYHDLIKVSKQVIFTLSLENKEEFEHINKDDIQEFRYRGIKSSMYLYGGQAPRNLEELFTYEHFHKMRHAWCQKLYTYFQVFMPGLTLKKMWQCIKNQRLQYRKINNIRRERLERKELKEKCVENVYKKQEERELNMKYISYGYLERSNSDRLLPLHCSQYFSFLQKKMNLIKDEIDIGWLDKHDIEGIDGKNIFKKPEFLSNIDNKNHYDSIGIPFIKIRFSYYGWMYIFKNGHLYYTT